MKQKARKLKRTAQAQIQKNHTNIWKKNRH